MAVLANATGQAVGTFTIPAGIPEGTKRFHIIGASGSEGETTFTGASVIQQSSLSTARVFSNADPLAQTFTLNASRFLGGVDLYFTAKGTKRVVVQVRSTNLGLPTQTILTQGGIDADAINLTGHTRITFNPFWAIAGTEYALVVLTDDADHAVAISELGKYDSTTGKWVTSQAYQVGVLLSSSNASTWTAHQDKDLTFRLLNASFTQTQSEIVLGENLAAENLTDVIVLGNVERPATGTDVEFVLADGNDNEYKFSEDLPTSLKEGVTGNLTFKARLKGTTTASPVIHPSIQVPFGTVTTTANYVTRSIPTSDATKLSVTFDATTPGTSSVNAFYQTGEDAWTAIPLASGLQLDADWVERTHISTSYTMPSTRVKIELNGSVLYRPKVRNLRIIAI
jgi:hypothetical protein